MFYILQTDGGPCGLPNASHFTAVIHKHTQTLHWLTQTCSCKYKRAHNALHLIATSV